MPKFDRTRTKVATVKQHVTRNRAKYAVAATTLVVSGFWLNLQAEYSSFIDARDLSDDFMNYSRFDN